MGDDSRGGRFQIVPSGDFRSEQRYHQRTHVLETTFETPDGRAVLTDWMPIGNGHSEDPSICRRIEVIEGHVNWSLIATPRFNDGLEPGRAERFRDAILFRGRNPGEIGLLRSEVPLELTQGGTAASARFRVEAPSRARFRWAWGRRAEVPLFADPFDTIETWRKWAHHCGSGGGSGGPGDGGCALAGPWHDLVARAGLTLKLLLAPYSGALAEAVVTPGKLEPRRAWIRDAAMTIQALRALGCGREADAHFSWLCDLIARDGAESLQRMYTLDGGRELPEHERRFHLDVYGHVALAASERLLNEGDIPERALKGLYSIADYLCQAWRRPDHGVLETPGKPEHFVASKVMSWVALDRVIRIAEAKDHDVPPRWPQERAILHRTILDSGFDESMGSFVRAFSEREIDASVLLIPMTGFLPPDDPRVLGTLMAVQQRLGQGALILRGSGSDIAHLPSSFSFASCLALCGRADEAADRLAELCSYATPLGFLGDQVDVSGETSGSFPSAFAHVALINAGLYVGQARGLKLPPLLTHVIGMPQAAAAPPGISAVRRRLRPLRRAG